MSIADRIKEARKNLGLTQEELARQLEVTKSAVSNYEAGVSSPKEPVLFKMFEVFQCDANYLFQDELRRNTQKKESPEVMATPEDVQLAQVLYDGLVRIGYLSAGQDITEDQLQFLDGLSAVIESFFHKGKQ